MKKYLLIIDSYGTFETDNERDAYDRYNYFYNNGIPVAMYTRTQYSLIKSQKYL